MIVVEPVESRADLAVFLDLPAQLYAGFAHYDPPLRLERAMMLDDRKSTFWKTPGNRCQYWIARKDGTPVGRISAQITAHTPHGIASGSGMFGCLDAINDDAVIAALIDNARSWLAEQGCTAMYGPCSLDFNMEPGLLTDGADEPPMFLSGWHPPYLASAIERHGLNRLHDLHYWRIDLPASPEVTAPAAFQRSARLSNLRIRYPTQSSYRRDIAILCNIYNDGWQNNWGFTPLTPRDLDGLDILMRLKVPRRAFKIVELDGQPVAVMLLIPNIAEWFRGMPPRPGISGWARLVWRALTHRFKSGRFIVTGMVRRLQGSLLGAAVTARMVEEMIDDCTRFGGEWAEAGWVLESNVPMIRMLERFGFRRNKTYRIYGLDFASALPSAA